MVLLKSAQSVTDVMIGRDMLVDGSSMLQGGCLEEAVC